MYLLIDFNHKLNAVASAQFLRYSNQSESPHKMQRCEMLASHPKCSSFCNHCTLCNYAHFMFAINLFLFHISLCLYINSSPLSSFECKQKRYEAKWFQFQLLVCMFRLLMKSRKDYCINSIDTLAKNGSNTETGKRERSTRKLKIKLYSIFIGRQRALVRRGN